jgi:hypothetical protein
LKVKKAQTICSPDIFSASSKESSTFFLNSSISNIFPFLMALDSEIQTPKTLKSPSWEAHSCQKTPITVFILELQTSIVAITFSMELGKIIK